MENAGSGNQHGWDSWENWVTDVLNASRILRKIFFFKISKTFDKIRKFECFTQCHVTPGWSRDPGIPVPIKAGTEHWLEANTPRVSHHAQHHAHTCLHMPVVTGAL